MPQTSPTSTPPTDAPDAWAAFDVLSAMHTPVFVADSHLLICYRNAAAASRFGDGRTLAAALNGMTVDPPFRGWKAEIRDALRRRTTMRFCGAMTTDGQRCSLHIVCSPVPPPIPGPPTHVVMELVATETTGSTGQEVELSRRLASLGKLAAQVAHELNNPLDGILRYINLAIRLTNESSPEKLETYLAESRTGLMRMMQIIGDLLEYSRTTGGEYEDMTVNEVIERAIQSATNIMDMATIVVAANFQSQNVPCVRGGRFFQVCTNLIRNAIDAMPEGGRLTLTTGIANRSVVVQVADTGVGLPEDVSRLFEPFYTTKQPGQGTGLGLAICRDFIEDMGGTLTASDGDDGGAVFTIRIPLKSCIQPGTLGKPGHGLPAAGANPHESVRGDVAPRGNYDKPTP